MTIEYKKNYLDRVILRIDFPSTPLDIEDDLPTEFLKIILQKFPVSEIKEVIEKAYRVDFKEDSLNINKLDKVKEFWHYDNNKKKSITISKKYIFFDYRVWDESSFEELEGIFNDIVSVLFRISDVQITRLGLRYINHITIGSPGIDPTEWDDYLNPNIVSIFKIREDRFQISRAFQNLELIFSDIRIRFQYGMHNPDYPAPIRKRLFILDYDGYCELLQDQKRLIDNLKIINKEIDELFRKSIGPKLEADMKKGESQ